MVVVRSWGMGNGELMEFQFCKMEKFWKWVVVVVAQRYECTECH